jgi:hypothetical protein
MELHRCLLEVLIYRHHEFDGLFLVFESKFVSSPSLENTKDGHIKPLKDLHSVWCKSYDLHSCLDEEMDHIISDMTLAIIHQ